LSESKDIKEIIKQEYIKSASDPIYFAKKYCYIQHPTRGRIPFQLYPFQEKVLKLFQRDEDALILKSRQLGISTLIAAYALWLMLFHKDKNVVVICTKTETAKNMVTKVKFMHDNLPSWLKIGKPNENNKLTFKLSNGSQIKAVSAAGDSGRSEAVSLLVIDEAAFIPNIEEIWGAIYPTLSTGGKCIALSTPNGVGGWFHKNWVKAELNKNTFLPIRLPWTVHPERDQTWRDEQTAVMGDRLASQECECNFESSGNSIFEPEILAFYEQTYITPPIEKRGIGQELWIWEYPDFNKKYMVVADTARGDSSDYSAFHVMEIETCTQVAEFQSQLPTKDFGNVLVAISTEYNNALLVIENANIGWAVIQQVIDRQYSNIFYSTKTEMNIVDAYVSSKDYSQSSSLVPGFTTSLRTRPLIIQKLESYIRDRECIIHSKRLLEEMRMFIWKNNRAEAQSGCNDDLTMSLGISLFVRDTALRMQQFGIDMTRASLEGISKQEYSGFYSSNETKHKDQWTWKDGRGNVEDLTWLI
jgi:hypothetical protein